MEEIGITVPDALLHRLSTREKMRYRISRKEPPPMHDTIKHFLLVFDHRRGELVKEREFGSDSRSALSAYQELELQHRHDDHIDIVLIGSDSLDTVRLTHANYYAGTAAKSKYLAGL